MTINSPLGSLYSPEAERSASSNSPRMRLHALQEATIAQQQADLAAKSAQAGFAAQDAARYRILAQTSAGSQQNAQRADSLDAEARAAVAAAAAGLEAARQQLKILDVRTEAARAAIAQAESDVQTARLNLGYTEIRSPIDGYVGNRAAQVGAYVTLPTRSLGVTCTTWRIYGSDSVSKAGSTP